jgi:hypothetical protein
MFPLGSVLFPGAVLPLHVFEPRYVEMINDVLDGDQQFGVVLIERGSEVGGGDVRFDVGTVARLARIGALDDDRLFVVAVGAGRFRVVRWLPDDPYPQAEVVPLDDPAGNGSLADLVAENRKLLRRVLALASELGSNVGDVDSELSDDPVAASWDLCSAAPVEQLDRQRLLETDDPAERLVALQELLNDSAAILQLRLESG